MILIGKANTSVRHLQQVVWNSEEERASGCIAGCSASGGQTQSPYIVGGMDPEDTWLGHSNPAGSTTGNAIAWTAGMAPVALGAEADGSIVLPSDRAALYSVRLSPDAISRRGVLPYNGLSDSLGPMTKSTEDAALMLNVLLGANYFTQFLGKSFAGLKIGFLDPVAWAAFPGAVKPNEDYDQQYLTNFTAAMDKIEAAGAVITRNVTLRKITSEDDTMCRAIAFHDYGPGFADFTAGCAGQAFIEGAAANMNTTTDEEYKEYCRKMTQKTGVLGLDETFAKYHIDVIIGALTGRSVSVYDLAGYPVGTMPFGYARFNGRPIGVAVVAPKHRDDPIIGTMSAWEGLLGPRQPPQQLVQGSEEIKGEGLQVSQI
ncbi:amidase signature domain-containing protein [Apodospora peruviana]|uniref:Amidase signature domain-containing protein n=1 Tax=Apodospora peruviana TaxID=516989 RepID=A0AAE0HUS2_9PEZI|nr:amidase signature domain-containing protein [Apodospora peruviana]